LENNYLDDDEMKFLERILKKKAIIIQLQGISNVK